jgi:phosphinothricin acetyltransferase
MEPRFATAADLDGIHQIYAPVVEQTAISFEAVPPTHEKLARRLTDTMPPHPWLVAVDRDRVRGYTYGHRFAQRAA